MTTAGFEQPILTGDPNQPQPYGRTSTTLSSADLIPFGQSTIANNYASSIIDVREWPYIQLVFATSVDLTFSTVNVSFFADAAGTLLYGSTVYRTVNNKRITDCFACEGPFVQISITFGGGGSHTCIFGVRGRTAPSTSGQGTVTVAGITPQTLTQKGFGALVPGFTNFECNFVQRGWALLTTNADTPGVFVCTIAMLDAFGAYNNDLVVVDGVAGGLHTTQTVIPIPGVLCRVAVGNTGGVNINAAMCLTMGPTP